MNAIEIESVLFRPGQASDSRRIAELFQQSADGVADYVWSQMRDQYPPGLSLLDIGERRYARPGEIFSYENCVLAEHDGEVVGLMHSYPIEAAQDVASDDVDPVLRPYAELELPGSLYLSSLSVLPDYQNRGIGSRFFAIARDRARALGLEWLSGLVFEQNEGSLRLHARNGFSEVDRRKIVPHELFRYSSGDVLLLRAEV